MKPAWPHQRILLNKIDQAFRDGKHKVLVVSPTGSGKTYLIFRIIKRALSKGKRVLLIVPLDILSRQARRDADSYGLSYGLIQAGWPENRAEPLQISTYQSLNTREWPDADIVLIDEAHLVSGCHQDVMVSYANIIGFSATPARTDKVSLLGPEKFECLIEGPTLTELTPQFLCPYRIFAFPYGKTKDYEGLDGQIIDHWKTLANDRQTILFGSSIEHSKDLANRFAQLGVSAVHLDKDTRGADRELFIKRFEQKDIQVICNYALFSLGFNVPGVACIVHARKTDSLVFYRQANGRGLRVEVGKTDCVILDHAGNIDVHGLPDEPVNWLSYNEGKKHKPVSKFKRCPECYLIVPISSGQCQYCQYVFRGVKKEYTPLFESQVKLEQRTKAKLKPKNPIHQGWIDVATELGKSKRWASAMARAYQTNDRRFLTQKLLERYDYHQKKRKEGGAGNHSQ